MKLSRLKWVCKAIEYDKLTNRESKHLFDFVDDVTAGKLTTKTAEDRLEGIFKEVQWREVDKDAAGLRPIGSSTSGYTG